MRRKPAVATPHDEHAARIAWWASFVATVALIAVLGLARSAQALTLPAASGIGTAAAIAPPLGEEDEDEAETSEDEEFEAEECEEDEEECEEGAGEEGTGSQAPAECLLGSASATVSASAAQSKVRLTIRYTTFSPISVAVDYWLRGSKGPLSLGEDRKHLARSGVIHEIESLSEAQMTKVMAARDFTVQLTVVNAPRYCHSFFDRHLTSRHAARGGLTWSDPESSFRASHKR